MVVQVASYPACLLPYVNRIAGVSLGACIDHRSHSIGAGHLAHAHVGSGDLEFKGWICVSTARALACRPIMLHEVAHVLTNRGHDERWRRMVLKIGGTLRPLSFSRFGLLDYRKGRRSPRR